MDELRQAKNHGSIDSRTRAHDVRILRVVDFELALARIGPQAHALLLIVYRDGSYHPANTAGLSARALDYKLPLDRQALAAALDSLDLP